MRRAVLAGALVVGLTAGCGSTGSPDQALAGSSEQALNARSAKVAATATTGSLPPMRIDGSLSWVQGTTGELTMGGLSPGEPTRAVFTEDAMYTSMPAQLQSYLGGKPWGKLTYADAEKAYGSMGQLLTAALGQTNPVRSAAMLRQAGDLEEVGEEQRNGVSTTHYAGTIELHKLVADLKLGLTDEVLGQLRTEFDSMGISAEHLELWLDERGLPVHAEATADSPQLGKTTWAADYSDYGGPKPVTAPPADQVYDMGGRLLALPN